LGPVNSKTSVKTLVKALILKTTPEFKEPPAAVVPQILPSLSLSSSAAGFDPGTAPAIPVKIKALDVVPVTGFTVKRVPALASPPFSELPQSSPSGPAIKPVPGLLAALAP
jgi:hypothetical protein